MGIGATVASVEPPMNVRASAGLCDLVFRPETQSFTITIPLTVDIPVSQLFELISQSKKPAPDVIEPPRSRAQSVHFSLDTPSPTRDRSYTFAGRSRKWSMDSASYFRKGSESIQEQKEAEALLRLATSVHLA